ncbi:MAG TPA: transcriptional regulator [Pontimonas sp.]|nr:transcriptional regulator [Pontimonas sp.]
MDFVNKKLVTIVAESALEKRLLTSLHDAGIKGYTVSSVHGVGTRNQRVGDLQGGNVKIECVVGPDHVDAIFSTLSTHFFPHYACVAWVSEVGVFRDERF